jgi:hypothetical protein
MPAPGQGGAPAQRNHRFHEGKYLEGAGLRGPRTLQKAPQDPRAADFGGSPSRRRARSGLKVRDWSCFKRRADGGLLMDIAGPAA